MKHFIFKFSILLFSSIMYAQSGHIMQGVGAVNMSMGGASTAQPIDISGALQWNPATISVFDQTIARLDVGLFFSSPELYSKVPIMDGSGTPTGDFMSGVTEDDRGVSPMPAFSMVFGKEESKHTFGVSVFGISGFGVTFPESSTNPINLPQQMGGFGHIESDYMLLQIGGTWAYAFNDHFSVGVTPNFNYASLELVPNPTSNPNSAGYPSTNKATAVGFGGQIGVFYDTKTGFKIGAAYKTKQQFGEFDFDNTYLDGSTSQNSFQMDYPAIYSIGLGYSKANFDLALDYRMVDYENTEGFSSTRRTPTGAVQGFGGENISIISFGMQYKGVSKLPLRLGYTYSDVPIPETVTFFNIPATAIIKNAFQIGAGYQFTDRLGVDMVFHYGTGGDGLKGSMLNPMMAQQFPPYGAVPGSEISYKMETSMLMFGVSYRFLKSDNEK